MIQEEILSLPQEVGDDLLLRWGRPEDADAVAEFFHPTPINKTLPIPGLISLVKRKVESTEQTKEETLQGQQEKQHNVISFIL